MSVAGRSSGPVGAVAVRVGVGASPDAVTFADGSLWVTNFDDGTVSRIDPAARRVIATVRVGAGPITAIRAGGAMWVANYLDGSVSRIDPATDAVTATLRVGSRPVGLTEVGAVLWVFDQGDGTAVLLDTRTGRRAATMDVGVDAGWSTLYQGRLWVGDFQGGSDQVISIDPRTRRIVAHVPVGRAPIMVSFAAGSGWVSNTGDATVTRFDPATGHIIATVRVDGGALGPLLATPSAVWVSVYGAASLARIDPITDTVTATLAVGAQPQNLAMAGSELWLAEGGDATVDLIRTS